MYGIKVKKDGIEVKITTNGPYKMFLKDVGHAGRFIGENAEGDLYEVILKVLFDYYGNADGYDYENPLLVSMIIVKD